MEILQTEYQMRRQRLVKRIEDNSVVVLYGATYQTRNHDCDYRFRQHSDFYYLTGFEEPDAALAITKREGKARYYLFCRERAYEEELWQGLRQGLSGAKDNYLADESVDINDFDETLMSLMGECRHVYYPIGDETLDILVSQSVAMLAKKVRQGFDAPSSLHDIKPRLAEMRLIKSDAEVAIIREVCGISAKAHVKAMQRARDANNECQLEAELVHTFFDAGCRYWAYDSIVAGGANACILHYTENNKPLADNDLILIDAGGELHNYAADITRTFPKTGVFTKEQKAIYELVLDAQLQGIACIRPGVFWNEIQETMVRVLTKGLLDLGILSGELDTLIEEKGYQRFYMHNSGHWLGLDVHDAGSYKQDSQWRPLEKGMVLTVEPGIYIDAHHKDIDKKWHNIGVRIEDDVLVTDDGAEVLTSGVPKSVDDVTALVSGDAR